MPAWRLQDTTERPPAPPRHHRGTRQIPAKHHQKLATWQRFPLLIGLKHNRICRESLSLSGAQFLTDSCGVCAAIWFVRHPEKRHRNPSWSLSTPNPKLLGPGDRRWRLHLSLSGNAVPIVWLPETAIRSSGHPLQNRSYCRVVPGSFPILSGFWAGFRFQSVLLWSRNYAGSRPKVGSPLCRDVANALKLLGKSLYPLVN